MASSGTVFFGGILGGLFRIEFPHTRKCKQLSTLVISHSPWQVLYVPEDVVSLAPLAAAHGGVVDPLRDLLGQPLAHELDPALGEPQHSLVLVQAAAVALGRLVLVGCIGNWSLFNAKQLFTYKLQQNSGKAIMLMMH